MRRKLIVFAGLLLSGAFLIAGCHKATNLHEAAKSGDLVAAKRFLDEDPTRVNAFDTDGWTPLHKAASEGRVKVAELLIENGADIAATTRGEYVQDTALHLAAQNNHKQMVALLIRRGAKVDAKGTGDATALAGAAGNGHMEIVEFLIANGADVNATSALGETPLHRASSKEVAEVLIANGADVHPKDVYGMAPLHVSIERGSRELVELLLANGADVNAKTDDGRAPLHLAATGGFKEIAELLIAKGADVEARGNGGMTPLHCNDLAAFLMTTTRPVNNCPIVGITPLHFAAWWGKKGMAELLIAHGADVNARDDNGITPLHLPGSKEIAEFLIAKGADLNAKDTEGKTPLMWAVKEQHADVAEVLRKAGAKE